MNAGGGMAAGMAGTLLRKRLEPMEEAWVEDKMRKAGEWLYIPEEWGIDMKKAENGKDTKANIGGKEAEEEAENGDKENEDDDNDNDNDDDDDAQVPESERLDSEAIPTKRVKNVLSADAIKDLWQHAHQEVFDIKYLRRTYPGSYPAEDAHDANEGDEDEGEDEDEEQGDDEDEDDDDDDDEFEDAMDTSGGRHGSGANADAAKPVVMMKKKKAVVGKLQTHQPVLGVPVLALGVVHKFMETGEV